MAERKFDEQEMLRFIRRYTNEHNYPPTYEEIGDAVGLKSKSTVHHHIKQLVAQHKLSQKLGGQPRTLRVLK